MSDATQAANYDIPTHPEEMKATYNLRVGKSISLQGSAENHTGRCITTGITICLIAATFAFINSRRSWR